MRDAYGIQGKSITAFKTNPLRHPRQIDYGIQGKSLTASEANRLTPLPLCLVFTKQKNDELPP
jgi:hypothetical protein